MKRALLAAAILTGCAPVRQPPSAVWFGKPTRVWALQTLQGEQVIERPGNIATVRLNPDRSVSGTLACNSISSAKLQWDATQNGSRGRFDLTGQGAGITTTTGCSNPIASATAGRFWDLMETARAWSMHKDELTIVFGDGSEARLVPLKHRGR